MDSAGSVTKISMPSIKHTQQEHHETSIRKKKLRFIITIVVLFTLIFSAIVSVLTIIKREHDSEVAAENKASAIGSVCLSTVYYDECTEYLFSFYKNNPSPKIDPDEIFSLFLNGSIHELRRFTLLLGSNDSSTRRQCLNVFDNSLSQLNSSVKQMGWLDVEMPRIEICLSWMVQNYMGLKTEKASYSLRILANIKAISDKLLGFGSFPGAGESMLASFMSDRNYVVIVCVFGWPYVILVLLVCVLLRVW